LAKPMPSPSRPEMASKREVAPERSLSSVVESAKSITDVADRAILRGAPLSSVLRRGGSILTGSAGSAADYQKSKCIKELDDFISHNWSVGRAPKFLALALHYNLVRAIIAAFTVGVAATALSVAVQPKRAYYARICGQVTFLVVLLAGHELKQLLGLDRSRVFLDKLCIHQTDEKLKRQGIAALAGFLRHSHRMVIVYTDVYLCKLWTVYEVASFLTLHGDPSRMVIVPTIFPICLMVQQIGGLLYDVGLEVSIATGMGTSSWDDGVQNFLEVVKLVFLIVCCLVVRHWHRAIEGMERAIARFSIQDATCHVETDRAVVHANVHKLMCFMGHVAPTATEAEALGEFDRLVRAELPRSLRCSLGRQVFSYKFLVGAVLIFPLRALDYSADAICAGEPPVEAALAFAVGGAFIPFADAPLGFALVSLLMRRGLELSGWRAAAYLCGAIPCAICPIAALTLGGPSLMRLGERLGLDGGLTLAGVLLYYGVLVTFGAYLFRPLPSRRQPERPAAAPPGSAGPAEHALPAPPVAPAELASAWRAQSFRELI